jgi:hypothetical protein
MDILDVRKLEKELVAAKRAFVEIAQKYHGITGYRVFILEHAPEYGIESIVDDEVLVLSRESLERLKEFLGPNYKLIGETKEIKKIMPDREE